MWSLEESEAITDFCCINIQTNWSVKEPAPVTKQQTQGDPIAAFIRVVKQTGGDQEQQTGQLRQGRDKPDTSKGSRQAEKIRVQSRVRAGREGSATINNPQVKQSNSGR